MPMASVLESVLSGPKIQAPHEATNYLFEVILLASHRDEAARRFPQSILQDGLQVVFPNHKKWPIGKIASIGGTWCLFL